MLDILSPTKERFPGDFRMAVSNGALAEAKTYAQAVDDALAFAAAQIWARQKVLTPEEIAAQRAQDAAERARAEADAWADMAATAGELAREAATAHAQADETAGKKEQLSKAADAEAGTDGLTEDESRRAGEKAAQAKADADATRQQAASLAEASMAAERRARSLADEASKAAVSAERLEADAADAAEKAGTSAGRFDAASFTVGVAGGGATAPDEKAAGALIDGFLQRLSKSAQSVVDLVNDDKVDAATKQNDLKRETDRLRLDREKLATDLAGAAATSPFALSLCPSDVDVSKPGPPFATGLHLAVRPRQRGLRAGTAEELGLFREIAKTESVLQIVARRMRKRAEEDGGKTLAQEIARIDRELDESLRQLQGAAAIGLEHGHIALSLAALDDLKARTVLRYAYKTKNRYVGKLAMWAVGAIVVIALGYGLAAISGACSVWEALANLVRRLIGEPGGAYCAAGEGGVIRAFALLLGGSAIGAWMSYLIRAPKIGFDDLGAVEPNQLHPAARVAFVAGLAFVVGLLLHTGVVKISIGGFTTDDFVSNAAVALLIGAMCGISEQALVGVFEARAAEFTGQLGAATLGARAAAMEAEAKAKAQSAGPSPP